MNLGNGSGRGIILGEKLIAVLALTHVIGNLGCKLSLSTDEEGRQDELWGRGYRLGLESHTGRDSHLCTVL